MAEVTKNVLKGYFTKGSVPTQSNYADLVDSMVSQSEMNTAISGVNTSVGNATSDIAKIAEILGKGQNETLTQLAAKFAALTGNYANVYAFVSKVKAFLEDTDATDTTINRWQEIESFLSGITDSDSLTAMLADLKSEIEGDLSIDSALNATSEHALQNKVLYDELRITETGSGSVLSVNGTNYPIVELDATDFDVINYTGAEDTDFEFRKIPTLDSNKAYIIKNANFSESNNDYSFSNQGTFIVKFQSSGNIGQYASLYIGNNESEDYYYYLEEETEFNKWLSIPATKQFNVSNWGTHSDNDTTIPYYGTPYEDGGNPTITEPTNATETTGSSSVVKSLKTKIAELEVRLAAVPTNYIEFTFDMSAYASAEVGKVVLYLGATTQDFTHCYFYEKTASGWKNASVSPVIN